MDWVADLSQKIGTLLSSEVITTIHEGAFDFVDQRLQTVGNSIENQIQTVGTNIENQLQTIRANIQQYCSNVEPRSFVSGNKNIEATVLKSSACSLERSGKEESNLAGVKNDNINLAIPEFSTLTTEPKILKKKFCYTYLLGEEIPAIADAEINGKGLENSSNFLDKFDSDADTASKMVTPTPDMYPEESIQRNLVYHARPACPVDFIDIIKNDRAPKLDEIRAVMDYNNNKQCAACIELILNGDPNTEKICEECFAKYLELNESAPESEVLNNNLDPEDDSFEMAELDCDSDWEIV